MALPIRITFTRVRKGRFTTEYREDAEMGEHPVMHKLLVQNWCLPPDAPESLVVLLDVAEKR